MPASTCVALRQQLRNQAKRKRNALHDTTRQAAEQAIYARLFNHTAFKAAKGVHCYLNLRHEVKTHAVFATCHGLEKRCFVPIQQTNNTLSYAPYCLGQTLSKKRFGVLEPQITSPLPAPEAIELVIMPGLAFAANGMRLGSGKGFYDRWLAHLKTTRRGGLPLLIGLGYGVQVLPNLVRQPHDILLDWIITECASIDCKHGPNAKVDPLA